MSLSPAEIDRYQRHILLKEIGAQGQQALRDAKVLVVGAGGIGAPLIAYLAAAGIGQMTICDDDTVSLSNLQRQIIFTTADQGRSKAVAAAEFVRSLNDGCQAVPVAARLSRDTAPDLIAAHDMVIEGVDNFETRFLLNEFSIRHRVPLLSAAIGRYDGQLSLFRPWDRDGQGRPLPCYRCLVPEAPPDAADCEMEGVLGPVPGVMGSLAGLQAIREICGAGESLAGHLLVFSGLEGTIRRLRLPRDPACLYCNPVHPVP